MRDKVSHLQTLHRLSKNRLMNQVKSDIPTKNRALVLDKVRTLYQTIKIAMPGEDVVLKYGTE